MPSRIQTTFSALAARGKKALIPFVTAGDPSRELTVPILHALVAAGADVIELGVPFSDPMADGPTIQRASERALANGISMRDVLAIATEFRQTDKRTPLVLMGYANPIEAMGIDRFAAAARDAGVDGVLVVDYPPEESGRFSRALREYHLDPIYLIAPTTSEARIAEIGKLASGYVYYVSLKGVTGAKTLDVNAVAARLPMIRQRTGLPVGVGFGIRDAQTAAAMARHADAVVVGSRIIETIEAAGPQKAVAAVREFVGDLRAGMDTV